MYTNVYYELTLYRTAIRDAIWVTQHHASAVASKAKYKFLSGHPKAKDVVHGILNVLHICICTGMRIPAPVVKGYGDKLLSIYLKIA